MRSDLGADQVRKSSLLDFDDFESADSVDAPGDRFCAEVRNSFLSTETKCFLPSEPR